MTTSKKFPINDVQFHEEALRQMDDWTDDGLDVLATWHVTAIAYLQYGAAKGLDGPGVERVIDGVVTPAVIDDNLYLDRDEYDQPYFRYTYKD